jgi:heat shock protein
MRKTFKGRIAGINFRLINDHAALAYNYGMYKGMSLPKSDEPPKIVAFVDCGHSATQVSIIAFNAGKAKILGAAYDLSVGGLHFDAVIRDSFAEQFKGTYKIDVRKNARAWFRLLDECEKVSIFILQYAMQNNF